MTFQKTLNVGDIITIKAGPIHSLVIKSGRRISPDGQGTDYWVDEISVVDIAMDRWGKPEKTIQYTDPKMRHFYFEGNGGMRGEGKPIKDTDIKVVGTSHLTTYVTTTHVMDHVTYYG